jgi:alpha-L-fucosidase
LIIAFTGGTEAKDREVICKMKKPREMTGAELKSMLKSSIHFKSLGGVKVPGLRLSEKDMAWWRDAKFGMFIHWGLYSILGRGEWVMHNEKIPAEEYAKLADEFKPKKFDANAWTIAARNAGMKYMVMVTRHHDGFALWDSPGSYNRFNSVETGAKRDFVKEYVEACRNAGLRVGLYYSPMDWRFPGYFQPRKLIDNALLMKKQTYDQVEELMTRYGTIDILWYDGAWLAHKGSDTSSAWFWEPEKLNAMVKRLQPKIVVNPRSGWEGDFYCDEGSHEINGKIIPVPWEKCMCICSGTSWGWIPDDPVTPFEDLITMFVNVFVRDGNVLLNVGPDRDGVIPEEVVERLDEIGVWMRQNGESIYGTRGGPFEPVDRVYGSTYCKNRIYLHVLDFDKFRELKLPPIENKITRCSVLGFESIEFKQDEEGIAVSIPEKLKKPVDTIVKMEFDSDIVPRERENIYFTGQ